MDLQGDRSVSPGRRVVVTIRDFITKCENCGQKIVGVNSATFIWIVLMKTQWPSPTAGQNSGLYQDGVVVCLSWSWLVLSLNHTGPPLSAPLTFRTTTSFSDWPVVLPKSVNNSYRLFMVYARQIYSSNVLNIRWETGENCRRHF